MVSVAIPKSLTELKIKNNRLCYMKRIRHSEMKEILVKRL